MWGGNEGEGGRQGMKTNPRRFLTLSSALRGPIRVPMQKSQPSLTVHHGDTTRQVDVWEACTKCERSRLCYKTDCNLHDSELIFVKSGL